MGNSPAHLLVSPEDKGYQANFCFFLFLLLAVFNPWFDPYASSYASSRDHGVPPEEGRGYFFSCASSHPQCKTFYGASSSQSIDQSRVTCAFQNHVLENGHGRTTVTSPTALQHAIALKKVCVGAEPGFC